MFGLVFDFALKRVPCIHFGARVYAFLFTMLVCVVC